jgi:membrane-anchored protein YejM (alkaline phosphatase superfamily)
MAEAGATASWIIFFIAAIVAVFVAYIGIAMWAIMRARDPEERKIRYRIFRDLLRFFGRGPWQ